MFHILIKAAIAMLILALPIVAYNYAYNKGYEAGFKDKTQELDRAFQLEVQERSKLRQEESREAAAINARILEQPKIVTQTITQIKEVPVQTACFREPVPADVISVLNDQSRAINDALGASTADGNAKVPQAAGVT